MGYIIEPDGIDFNVDPRPIKDNERSQLSEIIAYYKRTGKKKKITAKKQQKAKVVAE